MNNTIDPRTVMSHSLQKMTPQAQKQKDLKALREASRDFETMYVMEMYKAMRKAVPEGGLFEKSMSTDIYQEMLDLEVAKSTAAGKGIGIGEAMYMQMAELIEDKGKRTQD